MKKSALHYLLVAVAGLTAALLPINVLAAPGDLFEADQGSSTIFRFAPDGTKSTFASGLGGPFGLAVDGSGNVFEANFNTGTIFKFTPAGAMSPFASGLSGPVALAFDASGNLFVAESIGNAISKFTPTGVKSTFASGLSGPTGLAFDASGNLFETDHGTNRIFKFTPAGVKTSFAAGLNGPFGLAFNAGTLFESDTGTGTIIKFTSAGLKSTFATGLSTPTGLAFDASGNLFEADQASGTIFKFTPAGAKSTFASGLSAPSGLAFGHALAPTSSVHLSNISTRALVQTGNHVLIGGFIISGSASKQVLLRAIGPTLANSMVPNPLQDPVLSLHDTTMEIASNDNWQTAANASQIPAALRPTDPRESAILATLQPGAYTAIVSGKGGTSGVALVEVYDLQSTSSSELTNSSTRGVVQTRDFVMIGGFIPAGPPAGSIQVLVRAKGPSLAQFGIPDALADPTVRLFNGNGAVIASNDNWKDTQQAQIEATGNAPTNDLESAILITLTPGNYTAIVSGKNGGSGVGQVEVFKQP